MTSEQPKIFEFFNTPKTPQLNVTFNLATPRNSFTFIETCSLAQQTDNHPAGHIFDDLSADEVTDIREYYSSNEIPQRFKNVQELIHDLDN